MAQFDVLLLNGPNLNMLGLRDPAIYGDLSLKDIEEAAIRHAENLDMGLEPYQSNHEGALIDKIHQAYQDHDGVIINPGGFSHTSVALRDAIEILDCPVLEVHLSNIAAREKFRHHSYVSSVATGVISGMGAYGYIMALDAMAEILNDA